MTGGKAKVRHGRATGESGKVVPGQVRVGGIAT